jgi:ribosomal protein S12
MGAVLPPPHTQEGEMSEPKECACCGEVKEIRARNLCHTCYMRDWRIRKPEMAQVVERRRSQTEKRKQWRAQYNREYYRKNTEHLKQYQSDWRRNNPEQRDEYKRQRRARRKGLASTLTEKEWQVILVQYHNLCAYCGEEGLLVKEHWVPAIKGGGYVADNIVPSCQYCNARKGTMTGDEFLRQLELEGGYQTCVS